MSKSPPNIEGEDIKIARLFHDTYERLAPKFGYETRDDTKEFDPTTPNGKLMTAVCGEIKATIEREARRKTIEDIARAGHGYDDGTGFVLKISYEKLIFLNSALEDGLTPKERMQKLESFLEGKETGVY